MREILAAKKAAAAGAKPTPATPPAGNAQGRTPAKMLLSSAPTPEEQAILDEHKRRQAANAPARCLCEREADIPFVYPSPGDSQDTLLWKRALLAQETELGIVIEPDNQHAWLAITAKHEADAILLYRLPLLNVRKGSNPF